MDDTPAEAAFREEVAAWLATVTRRRGAAHRDPGCDDPERRLALAREFQRRKFERGYAGLTLPREYGGGGGTPIQQVIYSQEESEWENFGVVEIFGIGHGMCLPTILHAGTPEQRERYVRPALRGDEIWCQLFSEPAGGSDAAAARTRAARSGDGWRLNGHKIWTSVAEFADFGIITTRTDPSRPKHAGMTMFIADMRAPGVTVRPIRQMSDERDFCEVFFDDVYVPDEARIGAVDGGWQVALATLLHERAGIGARSRDLDWRGLLARAPARAPSNAGGAEDGYFRERVVDAWLIEFGARLLSYRGQTALSRGRAPGPEQAVLKMVKAPLIQQNAYAAMDAAGAAGILGHEELGDDWRDVERAWTFGAGIRIAGGSDEILRNIIAERVLGLPPDVRLDRNVPFDEIPG